MQMYRVVSITLRGSSGLIFIPSGLNNSRTSLHVLLYFSLLILIILIPHCRQR